MRRCRGAREGGRPRPPASRIRALAGGSARADVVGVGRDGGDHLAAQLGVALDEAGGMAVVDAEQVVEHQHLPVGPGSCADADHRHIESRGMMASVTGGRDRLEDDARSILPPASASALSSSATASSAVRPWER